MFCLQLGSPQDPWVACDQVAIQQSGAAAFDLFNGVSTHFLSECPGRGFAEVGAVCVPNLYAMQAFPLQVLSRALAKVHLNIAIARARNGGHQRHCPSDQALGIGHSIRLQQRFGARISNASTLFVRSCRNGCATNVAQLHDPLKTSQNNHYFGFAVNLKLY